MLTQRELEDYSRTARDANAAREAEVAGQQIAQHEAANRHRADEVLATLDQKLAAAAAKGEEPWLTVWHTQNEEHAWDTEHRHHPTQMGLRPSSIAALIRDEYRAKGYRVRDFWNIVIDFSPDGLGDYYQEYGEEHGYEDEELDGHHYVGG